MKKRSKIIPHIPGLVYLRETTWKEIVTIWEPQEAHQVGWKKFYKQQGYRTWREWRTSKPRPTQPERRRWMLFSVPNPTETVPRWYGGPFRGWRKRFYHGKFSARFSNIVGQPAMASNQKVNAVMRRFPRTTLVHGVVYNGDVYVLDGMHRCSAISLAARQKKSIKVTITIVLVVVRKKVV